MSRFSGRGRAIRESRRAGQFAKFKVTDLNLVPLVDTFVSVVFFALTTITVGELAPVAPGVTLPESHVGTYALKQLNLGVGNDVTVAGNMVITTADAAAIPSTLPDQPLVIPPLYSALRLKADSIRVLTSSPPETPLSTLLAIQADRTMRYDLLARIMQTARVAGFVNITLQVKRAEDAS
jgi:biopolymer transport protein ExbD